MKRDEAKAILELYRPGNTDDAQDPIIAEALGLLETDADLKAWFDEQHALDARISDSYNEIEPPTDLKANILAGMRLHAMQREAESASKAAIVSGKHDRMDHPTSSQAWWRNQWVGIAAVFAILFAIITIPREQSSEQFADGSPQPLQAGAPALIQFLAGEIDAVTNKERNFAKKCTNPHNLQTYLASVGTPSPATLPNPLKNAPSVGCFTLEYNGIKIGMICFKENELMHLMTVKKTDCMNQISDQPAIYEIGDQVFKVWVEGEQVQILSVHGTKEKLPKFI